MFAGTVSNLCAGKVTHATAGSAYTALRRQTRWGGFQRRKGLHLKAYHCPHCTGWHVGNAKD